MKRQVLAAVFALASLWLIGAGPGGFDKVEIAGSLPAELAKGETLDDFIERVMRGIVAPDHIMTPACGAPRQFQFLPIETREPSDSLARRYSEGEAAFFVIRVRSSGCGQTRVHNLFAFRRRGPFHLIVTTPGATLADLKSQLEVQRTLYEMVTPKDECADEALITDSVVPVLPSGNGGWSEIWSAQTCGVVSRFKISFSPGKSGTSYSIVPMV